MENKPGKRKKKKQMGEGKNEDEEDEEEVKDSVDTSQLHLRPRLIVIRHAGLRNTQENVSCS